MAIALEIGFTLLVLLIPALLILIGHDFFTTRKREQTDTFKFFEVVMYDALNDEAYIKNTYFEQDGYTSPDKRYHYIGKLIAAFTLAGMLTSCGGGDTEYRFTTIEDNNKIACQTEAIGYVETLTEGNLIKQVCIFSGKPKNCKYVSQEEVGEYTDSLTNDCMSRSDRR